MYLTADYKEVINMGKYNFDAIVDRRGTSCLKYDFAMKRKGRDDLLPMWVADMDFPLPEEILNVFHNRISHGIFGYSDPTDPYYAALNKWFSTHYGYTIEPEWISVPCGVVFALATAVKAFTEPGDACIIQQPVYYPFREVIENSDRKLVNSQLRYENGRYTMNYEDFEQKVVENNVKLYILCNPHNPVGRVWTKDELVRIADICLKHGVTMLVDEVHADFIYPGHKFTSFMTLDEKYREKLIVCTSPSKTFNVAGLQPASIIMPNPEVKAKFETEKAAAGYSNAPIMSLLATTTCYEMGSDWVAELVAYITENKNYFKKFVEENFPKAYFVEPEGTYLIWVDFSAYGYSDEELEHIMLEEAHLWLDSGKIFGPATAQFERFNIACPRSTIETALNQLKEALDNHKKW